MSNATVEDAYEHVATVEKDIEALEEGQGQIFALLERSADHPRNRNGDFERSERQ